MNKLIKADNERATNKYVSISNSSNNLLGENKMLKKVFLGPTTWY